MHAIGKATRPLYSDPLTYYELALAVIDDKTGFCPTSISLANQFAKGNLFLKFHMLVKMTKIDS